MEECRVCLTKRRNMRSVYEFIGSTNFPEMIMSIANIKICHDDGFPNKICLKCKNKLREAYEFKMLIERSDKKLRNIESIINDCNLKKIYFNNLNDIKDEIKFLKTEADIKREHNITIEDLNIRFENDNNVTSYNDTIIKRLNGTNEKSHQVLSVEDLLNTIKEENHDNDYINDDGQPSSDEDEYVPIALLKHKGKHKPHILQKKTFEAKKKTKSKYCSINTQLTQPIMPTIMEDIRLIPSVKKHIQNKPKPPKSIRKYEKSICPYCGKFTNSLKSHLLMHTGVKSYKCSECTKSYYHNSNLQSHMKIHYGKRDYKCNKCKAAFYCKSNLKSHMSSHTDIRRHMCKVCNKGFKRKGGLNRHEKRHSSANKTIKCEECNMSFFEMCQLGHHMRIHTGERPYKCEICSQPYSYKHDFNRHCLKKHGVNFKRRSVYVMNEEVLLKEQVTMKEMQKCAEGKTINPFEGP